MQLDPIQAPLVEQAAGGGLTFSVGQEHHPEAGVGHGQATKLGADGLVALHNRLMGELADLEHADERREELAQQVNVAEAEALELARMVGGGSLTEASEGWARALLAGQARPRRSERAA